MMTSNTFDNEVHIAHLPHAGGMRFPWQYWGKDPPYFTLLKLHFARVDSPICRCERLRAKCEFSKYFANLSSFHSNRTSNILG